MSEKPKLSEEELEKYNALEEQDVFGDIGQYKWDEEFQKYVLGMLLNDKHFLLQSVTLIKPEYFMDEVHRDICTKLFKYYNTYKLCPEKMVMLQEMREHVVNKQDEKIRLRYLSELNSVYEYYVPGLDTREYLLDKITTFAKVEALRVAFKKSIDFIKKQGPNEDKTWMEVYALLQGAMQIDRNFEMGLEYFQSYEERYERMKTKKETGDIFTSAFPRIDEALVGGGPQRGQIYAWVGLSGSGKSLMLVTAAVKNVCDNRKVLYVSLEMDEDSIAERFDAQFANVSINKLEENQDVVKQALNKEVKERQDDNQDSRMLVIKQFPAGSMDVNMLRAYLAQLKSEGFVPELVIVDYVGEMKDFPGIPTWESRYRIVRDMRGLATEENICIFTALQPNKGAREAQKTSVIDDDNLADAFGQIRPLDGCWSINQMKVEKEAGIARVFVVKHRHGKSRFDCFVEYDPQTLQIRQISGDAYKERLRKQLNERKASSSELKDELAQGIPKKAAEYWKKGKGEEHTDD